ncbi:MAG: rhomboid family intramembrane serine protease, partial [Chitinophagaceae bacterium]
MSNMRFPGIQILPPVIKNLMIVNALVFFAQTIFENNQVFNIEDFFALHDVHSVYFRPHQLVTYMFLHGGFAHLLFNMFALWVFGSALENYWGSKRFLIYYTICGIGAGLLHLGVLYFEMEPIMAQFNSLPPEAQKEWLYRPDFKVNVATVGASGSVFGCLAGYGYLFPNTILLIYGIIPVKAKWLVIFYGAAELFMGVANSAGDNVAHW